MGKNHRHNKRKAEDEGHEARMSKQDECKVIVMNFGKWKEKKELEAVLNEHQHAFKSIQKVPKISFGFVIYETKEERDAALQVLATIPWTNGENLEVKPALPKRSLKPMQDAETAVDGEAEPKTVMDSVTPWRNVPYAEQLERKEDSMKKVLVRIVRQTRKEYADKQKRILDERRRLRKVQKVPTLDDVVGGPSNVSVPKWLDSTGSLYLITGGKLFEQSLQEENGPWTLRADAHNITCLVSFASDLVAYKNDGIIHTFDSVKSTWSRLCSAPSSPVTAMASFRGHLVCATADGQILKRHVKGCRDDVEWHALASLPTCANAITVHQSYFYAALSDDSWQRAPLSADATEQLAFEPCDFKFANVKGVTSHDAKLIIVQQPTDTNANVVFLNDDGIPRASRDIQADSNCSIVGFASHKGLCCPMDPIAPSPVLAGYRNKCEFSCGFDADRKPVVGFRFGTFKNGLVSVGSPDECVNVPVIMKGIVATFQAFLDKSTIPVYDVITHEGVWRLLTIRASVATKEVMVCLQANPSSLEADAWSKAKNELVKALTSKHTIASMFVQEYTGVSAPEEDHPVEHVHGKTQIEEALLGLRFRISAQAFFQVNTPGAEVLYSLVRRFADADVMTQIYDVCCGTGTIGLCMASTAGKVVGVELCKAATDDAAVNAKLNNIENATFVNAKAEDVMKDLLRTKREGADLLLERAVAVVDPPRAGLHIKVLRALRDFKPVKRIVYVSCNPTGSLVENAAILCGPETSNLKGPAFKPVYAAPVDMFPHTEHCEMIVVFERL